MSIPIGLQLYSIRQIFAEDPKGTLEAVAKMGYQGVEFFSYPQHTAEELKGWMDAANLVCCGWHTPLDLVEDDKLEETIRFNKVLNNKYIVVPGLPSELTKTIADWRKMAAFFDSLATKLAEHGMYTGYHNHWVEFRPLDGELPWDALFGNTSKEVIMQLDTGNALVGGGDSVDILKQYPNRARTIHLKPYSKEQAESNWEKGFDPLIGDDDIDWQQVFALCAQGNTEWYIVEYESDAYPRMQAVEQCLVRIKGFLG